MDLEELRQVAARGESDQLEFKRSTGELREAAETLCGFLNEKGWRVLLGVANDGRVLGQQIADRTLQDVGNTLHRFEPAVHVECTQVNVADDLSVLMLSVPAGEDGPYSFDGRAYQRIGTTTQRMPASEYQRRLLARMHSQRRWENRIAEGYALSDLDVDEIRRTIKSAIEAGRLDSVVTSPGDVLDRLGLRLDGDLSQAAVVAFGRQLLPEFPQCSLRLARFRGVSKTEFLDQRQLTGHAFQLLDEAMTFILRHIPVAGRIESGKLERKDTPLYPTVALREALVNALCHRDYSMPGGAVSVAVFDDRLEITSTGLLPAGLTVADLKRDHVSQPRNPLLAEVFYRRGLIERWGRGTQKIVELCVAAGHPEPEFEQQAGSLTVRFLPSGYSPPLRVSHDLTERQQEILQVLSHGQQRSFKDVYEALQEPPSDRWVRKEMMMLRDLGLIANSGRGQHSRWWLVQPE